MDWRAFCKLWSKYAPSQMKYEYFLFLQFVQSHFEMKGTKNPIVVEIGVKNIIQSIYYKEFFNAEYIGIDIEAKNSNQIIMGDSGLLSTRRELEQRLEGRLINLLFIDGDHLYNAVKLDWELYHPLVENLVAIHDINGLWEREEVLATGKQVQTVNKFWNELYLEGKTCISFRSPGSWLLTDENGSMERYYSSPGIGVVVLDREPSNDRWLITKKSFIERFGEGGKNFPIPSFHYNGGLR